MPTRAPHRCRWPGCRALTTNPRCPPHERQWQAQRNAARIHYHGPWPAEARHQIEAHRLTHGDTCPGWRRDPHPIDAADWTCDHDVGPLCRSCNSSKGATFDRGRTNESP